MDADLGYQNGAFSAGIAYGVLFPMDALDHPSGANQGGPGFGFGVANTGSAKTPQTIQTRLMLSF